ncbi:DUF551 domain-containing protein [Pantoea ananatis]|uniref:DUF551 domain-containing protein n=1 Tax=Pantoea ananas TaxID=553 RepID=UPI003C13FC02
MISERMKQRIEEMPDAQLIDWICLYCVDVRSTPSDDDAQEFINDIRQALEMRLNAPAQPFRENPDSTTKSFRDIEETTTIAQPVSDGWVKCSERMPHKGEKVFVFIDFNSNSVPPSIHDAEFTGQTFRRGGATIKPYPLEDGFGVTHWMPLPAAPGGQDV